MADNIRIYTTPTCPYCKMAKEFLISNGIQFDEVDVSSDEAGIEEMIEKSGQMGVPVLDIDGKMVVGFDEEEIRKALGI